MEVLKGNRVYLSNPCLVALKQELYHLESVKVYEGLGYGCDEEAVRLIKESH